MAIENEITISLQLARLYNVKLRVSKSSGERTYNSLKEQVYYLKFASCSERSVSADINPKSCHLTTFELINPLFYINFSSFQRKVVF